MKINKRLVTKFKLALLGAVSATKISIKFDNQMFKSVSELSDYAVQKEGVINA